MRQINLDRRLSAVAAYVKREAVVADIGCDHGYLAAYLALNGIAKHVYASDVNPKPLAKAEKLIDQYGLNERVTIILSDGLASIPHDSDTIIMAGMGGELIAGLLSDALWAASPGRQFILQPMTFAEKLRQHLAENGFEIISETPVLEEKHTYCIINAHYTGERHFLTQFEAVVGKIDYNTAEGQEYAKRLYEKYSRVLNGLKKAKTKNGLKEVQQLVGQLKECLED